MRRKGILIFFLLAAFFTPLATRCTGETSFDVDSRAKPENSYIEVQGPVIEPEIVNAINAEAMDEPTLADVRPHDADTNADTGKMRPEADCEVTYGLSCEEKARMIRDHAPVLQFHPAEKYFPISAEKLLETKLMFGEKTIRESVNMHALLSVNESGYALAGGYPSPFHLEYPSSVHRGDLDNAPAYVHFRRAPDGIHFDIQYWFCYAFNGDITGTGAIYHDGDWEHITVRVTPQGVAQRIYTSAHYGEGVWTPASRMPSYPFRGKLHPVIYVALNSHAAYTYAGTIDRTPAPPDWTAKNGPRWHPFTAKRHLIELGELTRPKVAWLKYSGYWGRKEIGWDKNGNLGNRPYSAAPRGPAYQNAYDADPAAGPGENLEITASNRAIFYDQDNCQGKTILSVTPLAGGHLAYDVFDNDKIRSVKILNMPANIRFTLFDEKISHVASETNDDLAVIQTENHVDSVCVSALEQTRVYGAVAKPKVKQRFFKKSNLAGKVSSVRVSFVNPAENSISVAALYEDDRPYGDDNPANDVVGFVLLDKNATIRLTESSLTNDQIRSFEIFGAKPQTRLAFFDNSDGFSQVSDDNGNTTARDDYMQVQCHATDCSDSPLFVISDLVHGYQRRGAYSYNYVYFNGLSGKISRIDVVLDASELRPETSLVFYSGKNMSGDILLRVPLATIDVNFTRDFQTRHAMNDKIKSLAVFDVQTSSQGIAVSLFDDSGAAKTDDWGRLFIPPHSRADRIAVPDLDRAAISVEGEQAVAAHYALHEQDNLAGKVSRLKVERTKVETPPMIELYSENGGTGDLLYTIEDLDSRDYNLTRINAIPNDKIRSVRLWGLPAGTVITLHDVSTFSTMDDWTAIHVKKAQAPNKSFATSLENDHNGQDLVVRHFHRNGLRGKVSFITVRRAASDYELPGKLSFYTGDNCSGDITGIELSDSQARGLNLTSDSMGFGNDKIRSVRLSYVSPLQLNLYDDSQARHRDDWLDIIVGTEMGRESACVGDLERSVTHHLFRSIYRPVNGAGANLSGKVSHIKVQPSRRDAFNLW